MGKGSTHHQHLVPIEAAPSLLAGWLQSGDDATTGAAAARPRVRLVPDAAGSDHVELQVTAPDGAELVTIAHTTFIDAGGRRTLAITRLARHAPAPERWVDLASSTCSSAPTRSPSTSSRRVRRRPRRSRTCGRRASSWPSMRWATPSSSLRWMPPGWPPRSRIRRASSARSVAPTRTRSGHGRRGRRAPGPSAPPAGARGTGAVRIGPCPRTCSPRRTRRGTRCSSRP